MRLRFFIPRIAVSVLSICVLAIIAGCHHDTITGANGALGNISVDAPDSATSGQNFDIHVTATAIGVQSIQNTVVTVNLPAPLTVVSVHTDDPQTTATSTSNSVTWTIGSLDSNTQSGLTVTAMGTTTTQMTGLAVTAQMTGSGINPGDAVATDTLTLNP